MSCIYYVNAPAGAGKSYAALNELVKGVGQTLLVVPSIKLSDELVDALTRLDPTMTIEVINGSKTSSVVKETMTALNQEPIDRRVVIVTWSAFERLPYFPAPANWRVIIDEVPQAVTGEAANVPTTHIHLTDHIVIHPIGGAYGRVDVESNSPLKRIVSMQDDALQGKLTSMAHTVLSPHRTSYVRLNSYKALLDGSGKRLAIYSELHPRIFKYFQRVTILSANFCDSLLFKIWKQQHGVIFKEDIALSRGLRYQSHSNGSRLKIYYGTVQPWSKALRDRDEKRLLKALVSASVDLMGDEPFIWAANIDVPDTTIVTENAARLPQAAQGLNEFSTTHNVVYVSARIPPPNLIEFLGWRGIDDADLRKAIHEEALYQAVMRSSLRDPNCEAQRRVVVPDYDSALYLQGLFPGSGVVKLDLGIDDPGPAKGRGRKKIFDTEAARVRAHRSKQAQARSDLAAVMSGEITTTADEIAVSRAFESMRKPCNENAYRKKQENVTSNLMGTIFDNLKATHPIDVVPAMKIDEFIKALKEVHRKKRSEKRDNMLICPSVFDAERSDQTNRGLTNVVYANGLWFDVDVGDMTHKNLAAIFPHIRIIVFNSFSSTRTQPRYRVYVPTSRTMSIEEYSSISHQFVQIIEETGFVHASAGPYKGKKRHGIDKSKLHAASLFYLPCQPEEQSGVIWKDYRSGDRKPLDVDGWLDHAVPNTSIDTDIVSPIYNSDTDGEVVVDISRVEAAKDRWYTIGIMRGNGDREMYRLAMDLRKSGLPVAESKIVLEDAARSATSPKGRLTQVGGIIRKYSKNWYIQ